MRNAREYEVDAEDRFTRWDVAANTHLLAYFREKLAENSRRYGRPPSYLGMKNSTLAKSSNADASAEWIANVQRIVAAKNVWVAEMTDLAAGNGGEVPAETQREIWDELIGLAEAQVTLSVVSA